MSFASSPRAAFGLGLAGTLFLFGLGLGLTLPGPLPAPAPSADPAETRGPAGPLTYLPLPEPIRATIRGNRRQLSLGVAFAVEGSRLDLAAMAGLLKTDMPLLVLDLAEAVRACDERHPTLDALRRALPGALREVANGRYGTEAVPDPVFEALVTDFIVQ